MKFLDEEFKTKCKDEPKMVFETSFRTVPQQDNCDDCGVFTCMFADYVSREAEINFSQADMVNCRERIAWELIHGKFYNSNVGNCNRREIPVLSARKG